MYVHEVYILALNFQFAFGR